MSVNDDRESEVAAAIEAVLPFIKAAAVDELALRLSGLSGDAYTNECKRLTKAILTAMRTEGDIGTIENIVVLATLKAATTKVTQMQSGHA